MFLEIKIESPVSDKVGVSIQWIDAPEDAAIEDFDSGDQAWTKICDGIHALLATLGPIPEGGWEVKFNCPDPSLIIEEGLTRDEYHSRALQAEE